MVTSVRRWHRDRTRLRPRVRSSGRPFAWASCCLVLVLFIGVLNASWVQASNAPEPPEPQGADAFVFDAAASVRLVRGLTLGLTGLAPNTLLPAQTLPEPPTSDLPSAEPSSPDPLSSALSSYDPEAREWVSFEWAMVSIQNPEEACPDGVCTDGALRLLITLALDGSHVAVVTDVTGQVMSVHDATPAPWDDPAGRPWATLTAPRAHATIHSPLGVEGEASRWMFEADFPVGLFTTDGKAFASGYASATEAWMTVEAVPFQGELTFDPPPAGTRAFLVLARANPSDLAVHSAFVLVPVTVAEVATTLQ